MLLATSDIVAGKDITETLGLVKGNSVQSRNIGRDMIAGLRNIVGGEMKEYAEMLVRSREIATEAMVEEAKQLGGGRCSCRRSLCYFICHGWYIRSIGIWNSCKIQIKE